MVTDHRAALARIKRFDQLIPYLRDEMGWPIARDSFEDADDLFYDFTADELGIDPETAAKIESIKRLRPLTARQPWGIFFVKFEPKRLPVVALRRLLGQVALKKRASANSAERAAWAADDLLFVSNYGEGDQRQITFAHFSQADSKTDLPTLKVLGWDNLDTQLHIDKVAELLREKLAWPEDEEDLDHWRSEWRSAFTLRHREVIISSRELSSRLADLARAIRDRIRAALAIETDTGPLTRLMKAFREALVHDLDTEGFADMYAQTIAYGLLSARITNPTSASADDLWAHVPVTNPFLKDLMATFLHVGGRRGTAGGPGIDFDELGVSEVVELLDRTNVEAVVRDFGNRNPEQDPVIHFYEDFLAAYDKEQKVSRGVFYTPRPVVSYIVRSVDQVLRQEFGLEDGLADTTTWGEMAKRHSNLELPNGVDPAQPFVQILDPATGTGTFLVEVIDVIYRTMSDKWSATGAGDAQITSLWNDYVADCLLTRLHGYELLMAPYAIAHLKIGLKLHETGYRFNRDERARIYLTNALEPAQDFSDRLDFAVPALAHEAHAVNAIKLRQHFTVVVGNPPYSKLSANLSDEARALVDAYRYVAGERIKEKGALQFEMNLQDDYVKFVRLAEEEISHSGTGTVGIITNSGYLANPTLRGMRWSLSDAFGQIDVLDLKGQHAARVRGTGTTDENVFDIQQGVAIALLRRSPSSTEASTVQYGALTGLRQAKYRTLATSDYTTVESLQVSIEGPLYKFTPSDTALRSEFAAMLSLPELFPRNSAGFITSRDGLVIDSNREALEKRITAFGSDGGTDDEIYAAYGFQASKRLNLGSAQAVVRDDPDPRAHIRPCLYRPFDRRWVYYKRELIESYKPIADDMLVDSNLGLLATRQVTGTHFEHVFVSRAMIEIKACSHDRNTQMFPLYVATHGADENVMFSTGRRAPNLSHEATSALAAATGLRFGDEPDSGGPGAFCPQDVLQYVYAILHAVGYRTRYIEFLRSEFPRVPVVASHSLFLSLTRLGGELIALHLMEAPELDTPITTYTGPEAPDVGRVGWSEDTVWLDAAATRGGQPAEPGTVGFRGVSEAVWNFHIGGYQVCHKWLKDRKGRTLSHDDLAHYQKIIVALDETIRLMADIDNVIETHGGWPGAFLSTD